LEPVEELVLGLEVELVLGMERVQVLVREMGLGMGMLALGEEVKWEQQGILLFLLIE